jgi:outer membrane protein OmpA-like peptidoglycan-associated protein
MVSLARTFNIICGTPDPPANDGDAFSMAKKNEEKAHAMLNRWVAMKKELNSTTKDKRPSLSTDCNDLQECERWRNEVIKEITKTDTVFIEQIQAIESQFNSVQFKAGSADIPEAAKYALYDLAKIFDKNPTLNIKVEGHTSKEGDANFNKKLSEKRAKSVVDFLVSKGVSTERISFEGFGSSKPIDSENPDKNRRTEFVIVKK